MNAKHSTAQPITDSRPIARTVRSMRVEAFTLRVLAGGIVVVAVGAAVYLGLPGLALFGLVAAWPALSAHWLAEGAARTAEALPPKPKRAGPHWLRRLWWWFARKQTQQADRPKPWRGVSVDGQADAIKLPYRQQEMAQASEPPIVHGYTASDVYAIVCEASARGLGERVWQLDKRTVTLPSGQRLSREGFRAVQRWLVKRDLATSTPYYQLTVTPEVVAGELEKP